MNLLSPNSSADVTPAEFQHFSNLVLDICKETLKCSVNITHFNLPACLLTGVRAHTHCTGQGLGNDGFLYYTMYCTHYTGTGMGTGNHCFPSCLSRSLSQSRSRSRAVCMNHKGCIAKRFEYVGGNGGTCMILGGFLCSNMAIPHVDRQTRLKNIFTQQIF